LELIKGILALLYLLAYGVFSIALMFLPTLLNMLVSALFTYPLMRITKNRWVLVPVFLTVSFALAMNVRLFEVVSDIASQNLINKNTISQMDRATSTLKTGVDADASGSNSAVTPGRNVENSVSLPYGTAISLITDTDMITYKRRPSVTLRHGGSGLGNPIILRAPELISESIADTLLAHGLVIRNDLENPIVLKISTETHNNLLYVDLWLRDRDELVAETSLRLRQKHSGEVESSVQTLSSEGLTDFLIGNTVWNYFLQLSGLLPEQNPALKQFLVDHMQITSAIREKRSGLVTVLEEPILDPRYAMRRAWSGRGDRVGCNLSEVAQVVANGKKNVQLTRGGTVRLLELETRYVNKILCTEDRIYLVETPGPHRDHVAIYEYDFDGVHQGNHQFTLPAMDWPARIGGALIYFRVTGDSFVAGLAQVRLIEGRRQPVRHFYYHLSRTKPG
jgi:hypothetical protein